jgi:hypothetical protein
MLDVCTFLALSSMPSRLWFFSSVFCHLSLGPARTTTFVVVRLSPEKHDTDIWVLFIESTVTHLQDSDPLRMIVAPCEVVETRCHSSSKVGSLTFYDVVVWVCDILCRKTLEAFSVQGRKIRRLSCVTF